MSRPLTVDGVLMILHERLAKLETELAKVNDLADGIDEFVADYWGNIAEGDDHGR